MDTTKAVTHLSLCTGYGGIDLGLRRAIPNLRTVAYAEIDAFAIEVLLTRMESGSLDAAPIWTDVRDFPWHLLHGSVDILSAGYPCQPFSHAGLRKGGDDERHLWPHIRRGIEAVRPAIVFLENVEGHIWMSWVTAVRGEYSARRNAVRRIAGTECSSLLPTPCANEDSFRLNGSSQQSKTLEAMARRGELRTAATGNVSSVDCLSLEGANAIMVNLNVTTAASGHIHSTITQATDVPIVELVGQSGGSQQAGPLNPSFVETMMGLPIGWTDCDSSETGSSQQPPL